MAIDIKGIMGNNKELEEAKKLKTYIIDLAEIDTNEDNPYKIELDEINTKLANNIEKFGLINPVRAKYKNGRYVLTSGERRYRAMCYLSDNNRHYFYNGVDITGKAPVNFSDVSEDNEVLEMVSANVSRDMTADDKYLIVKKTYVQLMQKIEFDQINEKEIGSKAKWLSEMTGYSEHFCKDSLAKVRKEFDYAEEHPFEDGTTATEEKSKEYNAKKELMKYIKSIKKFAEKMGDTDVQTMIQDERIVNEDIQALKLAYNALGEQMHYLMKVINEANGD